MDELLDTTSVFSSIVGVPTDMERQYSPLKEVFESNPDELPDQNTPEPNSEAIVRALNALQEKIHGLELERVTVVQNFTEESQKYVSAHILSHNCSSTSSLSATPFSGKNDLSHKMGIIDAKFSDQAHGLEGMKNRLQKEESTREQSIACSRLLKQQHRELLQQQKQIMQHISHCHKRCSCRKETLVKPQIKRKKVNFCSCGPKNGQIRCCKPMPGVHYRMNLHDVPFLLTTSITPSHSLAANYQQVLASMKSHSHLLCGAAAAATASAGTTKCHKPQHTKKSYSTELNSLLAGLEEEFGHLTFKHYELVQQLKQQTDQHRVQNYVQLECELQTLVDRIEMKAKQINTLRKHLKITPTKKKKTSTSQQCSSEHSPRDANVKLLQKMKALQSTLQEDDLCWD